MINPEASIQHFDRVSQSHPEAFTSNFFLNMMPIHLACSNLKISEGIMLRLVTENLRSKDDYLLTRDKDIRIPLTCAICAGLEFDIKMCLFKAEPAGPTFFSVDEEKEITRLEKIELEYENDFLQLLENWDSGSE